jgi:glycosyltransferase involved in cell wall biosynthesis
MPPVEASVVIPTYNGSRFLRETLESVFAQTRLPQEILLVDDASTDGTPEVLAALAARAPVPVRLLRMPRNSGSPVAPLNFGLAAAHTPLIVPLDQDDRMTPDRIAALTAPLLARPDAVLAFGLSSRMDADGTLDSGPTVARSRVLAIKQVALDADVSVLDPRALYLTLLTQSNFLFGASNIAFRRAAWEAVGRLDASYRITWDFDFLCRLTGQGPIVFVNRIINHWRRHEAALSGGFEATTVEALRVIQRQLQAPAWPLTQDERRHIQRGLARIHADLGYRSATAGHPASALAYYWSALRLDADFATFARQAVKILPKYLVARFGRGARSAGSLA